MEIFSMSDLILLSAVLSMLVITLSITLKHVVKDYNYQVEKCEAKDARIGALVETVEKLKTLIQDPKNIRRTR